jgi:putative MATE family efflux protein
VVRRSPYDGEILRLALPALGALASEPLYVLADTAIVGHLGTNQLAALAISATVLTTAFSIFNFLTYGTTAQVARLHGAGRRAEAAGTGAQAQWTAICVGLVVLVAIVALARPLARLMGAEAGAVEDGATTYLRIAALGAPMFLLAAAGQGYLRGAGDLRTPLVILVVAQGANLVLEVLFVYGFGWGLAGSAWGTVIAQAGMGGAFLWVAVRAGWERPVLARMRALMRVGVHIAVRTSSLLGAFVVASAVLARIGSASVAAHQIAFQLFIFLALVLDAVAIAAQVLVARFLGAGDSVAARAAATRMIWWSVVLGAVFGLALAALHGVLPNAFSGDARVLDRAHAIWWIFAVLMPVNGAIFALDGILIGAGDTRYLMWAMLLAAITYVPISLLALDQGWGIVGVWWGLAAMMLVRLAGTAARFAGERWAVVGG